MDGYDFEVNILKEGEALWNLFAENESLCLARFWLNKWGCIDRMLVYEVDNELYLEKDILGIENIKEPYFHEYYSTVLEKRKIVPGTTISDFSKNLSYQEKINLYTQYFDWVFENYTVEPSDSSEVLISNLFFDALDRNILVNETSPNKYKFELIDYTIVPKKHLEKGYIIWILLASDEKLYAYFNKKYDITITEETICKYRNLRINGISPEERNAVYERNKPLREKYLSQKVD